MTSFLFLETDAINRVRRLSAVVRIVSRGPCASSVRDSLYVCKREGTSYSQTLCSRALFEENMLFCLLYFAYKLGRNLPLVS